MLPSLQKGLGVGASGLVFSSSELNASDQRLQVQDSGDPGSGRPGIMTFFPNNNKQPEEDKTSYRNAVQCSSTCN